MYDIKSRRLSLNMTLEDVGEIVGVGKSTVRKWENGMIDNMKRDKIALLAKALKISPLMLLSNDANHDINDTEITAIYNQLTPPRQTKVYDFAERQLEQQKRVKIYGQVAANPEALDYVEDGFHDYITENVPNNADGALVINGDSMEPDYPNGSIVFYKKQKNIENGELAVVDIDGDGSTCKKVIFDYDNRKVILKSLNEEYPDREIDGDRINIVGKVIN